MQLCSTSGQSRKLTFLRMLHIPFLPMRTIYQTEQNHNNGESNVSLLACQHSRGLFINLFRKISCTLRWLGAPASQSKVLSLNLGSNLLMRNLYALPVLTGIFLRHTGFLSYCKSMYVTTIADRREKRSEVSDKAHVRTC